jgi:hypothetical protein
MSLLFPKPRSVSNKRPIFSVLRICWCEPLRSADSTKWLYFHKHSRFRRGIQYPFRAPGGLNLMSRMSSAHFANDPTYLSLPERHVAIQPQMTPEFRLSHLLGSVGLGQRKGENCART